MLSCVRFINSSASHSSNENLMMLTFSEIENSLPIEITFFHERIAQGLSGAFFAGTAELSFYMAESSDGKSAAQSSLEQQSPQESGLKPARRLQSEQSLGIRELLGLATSGTNLRSPSVPLQAKSGKLNVNLGDHLFTLSLSGELSVHGLTLDPDTDIENGWRLNLAVKVRFDYSCL